MPRKKKEAKPVVGIGKAENKLMVQKSRPLFSLWRSDMSLPEFKILDTYLSRIDSRNPDRRTVIFTKGELEQLLGVKKINKADIQQRLAGLYRGVEIERSPNRFHTVALFEEAVGDEDEDGFWTVKLTCSAPAMKYIFNIEELGYLRYKLRCITSLTSRYTYILFMYLEANRFRKSWEVELNELRHILNCDSEPTYQQFKYFNDLILKKCQKELLEKSECRFTYEPIKKGRIVVALRFRLETLSDIIEPQNPDQLTISDIGDPTDPNAIYADVLPKTFSAEEVEALRLLAAPLIPYDPFSVLPHECHLANYLAEKVAQMKASKSKIRNQFKYLQAMIEADKQERS